jgi:hypothetical protein
MGWSAALLGEILAPAIKAVLRPIMRVLGRWMRKHISLKQTLELNHEIDSKMTELRVRSGAHRVCLFQFHNGGVFSNKKPQFRVVCTNEMCGPGVGTHPALDHPIMASRVIDLISPLFALPELPDGGCCPFRSHINREIYTIEVSKMRQGFARHMLERAGVSWAMIAAIHDEVGSVVGYVKMDYCNFGGDDPEIRNCTENPSMLCVPGDGCHRVQAIDSAALHIENLLNEAKP